MLGWWGDVTRTSFSLVTLPVVGCFQHLVTLGEIWLGMHVWLQLLTLELAGTWIVDNVVIDRSYNIYCVCLTLACMKAGTSIADTSADATSSRSHCVTLPVLPYRSV